MNIIKISKLTITGFIVVFMLSACAPEVGSDRWCKELGEKPKGDWTANELADYTRHCVLK